MAFGIGGIGGQQFGGQQLGGVGDPAELLARLLQQQQQLSGQAGGLNSGLQGGGCCSGGGCSCGCCGAGAQAAGGARSVLGY